MAPSEASLANRAATFPVNSIISRNGPPAAAAASFGSSLSVIYDNGKQWQANEQPAREFASSLAGDLIRGPARSLGLSCLIKWAACVAQHSSGLFERGRAAHRRLLFNQNGLLAPAASEWPLARPAGVCERARGARPGRRRTDYKCAASICSLQLFSSGPRAPAPFIRQLSAVWRRPPAAQSAERAPLRNQRASGGVFADARGSFVLPSGRRALFGPACDVRPATCDARRATRDSADLPLGAASEA